MVSETQKIAAFLSKYRALALDTMLFIYQFQAHPRYGRFTRPFFRLLSDGAVHAVTTTVTLAELLVRAYAVGDARAAGIYRSRLVNYPNLKVRPISVEFADRAAELRAKYNLRLPDCLQLAVADEADAFLTNDERFGPVRKEVPILLLKDIMHELQLDS